MCAGQVAGGFQTLLYEKRESVAYVTLNRPEALNVYNVKMRDELYEVLGAIRDDPDVNAVVLKGAGDRAFCAGADLSEFLTAPPPAAARRVRWERDVWGLFLSLPQPVVAALHGYVLGSGIEMALCCDLRVASDDARFGLPEVTLGIIPAAGGSQTLPRTIGRAKSLEMLLTNRWIDAREALSAGLVNRVVGRKDLIPTVERLAGQLASLPPPVARAVKEAVSRGASLSLQEGLDMERRLVQRLLSHPAVLQAIGSRLQARAGRFHDPPPL
ncbi:MAG: enoyl-CoA hydratase/isomerase family protein [Dehalococcoidia bacterium]|nr:enoyl-CoA hydratase/isomerase family protein [Dehalococcoidia bacterium]